MNLSNISNTAQVLSAWYKKAVKLGQVVGDNSLSDLTQTTKVEPLVILSKDCIGIEAMPDVMQGLLNYTIADYMQAVALYGRIDDVRVRRTLAAFNPNRDGSAGALLAAISNESLSDSALKFSLPTGNVPTMEADGGNAPQGKGGKFSTKELQDEAKNMSVGKLIEVPFTPTGAAAQVTLPIQFRLLASYANSSSLLNVLLNGVDDTNFFSRFERARDGGISSFSDFIGAQDMIAEKRKVLYSDDGKMLGQILSRAANNKRAAIASGIPSLASMSNIFIITAGESKEIAHRVGRPLDVESTREEIFRNVSASAIVVVDSQWAQVTYWHRGYSLPLTLDFKQLKASSGGKGPDLMDMFRQFNLGMPVA